MLLKALLTLGMVPLVFGKAQYMGMNIAGFEFGCETDGTCPTSKTQSPMGSDAVGQMQHFVKDDQMNIFRLPVSWQFLVNNKLGGTLDANNFGKFDQLIQACLGLGTFCAIDLHNFARWNGQIIGQSSGAVTDAQFADVWSQLATKYKTNQKVIFGLMNEPHDLDVPLWANSVQAAVTAIRNAGATSQMILLPGTNFASAGKFVSSGSGDALIKVKNPDGTVDGLVLDLHKYLDEDNSGTHAECTTDNIVDAFAITADFLRKNGRKALVSETGAGNTATCLVNFCAQNKFINDNSDVLMGYIAWAAGSFGTSYVLSLTPSKQNGKYVDNKLAAQCVVAPFVNAGPATFASSAVAVPTPSSAVGSVTSSQASTTNQNANRPSSTSVVSSRVAQSTSISSGTKTASFTGTSAAVLKGTGGIFATGRANQTVSASITGPRTSVPTLVATGGVGSVMRSCGSVFVAGSLVMAAII
ncbi:hypothetical protein VTL71DRAFT_2088 [Oculimacula yallundae]|uniref:cellulase n=1 Tax=Oculimacula yallundae TaxID=86028 RepID=A0ABR4C920_9HELO